MLDFFAQIAGFLETVWQYLESTFNTFILALQVLVSSISLPLHVAAFLPDIIYISVSITVSIYVVKFILGR